MEVNPAFERLTGMKREDLVGRTVEAVLPEGDPFWTRIYGEVAQGEGGPARFEDRWEKLKRDYKVFSPDELELMKTITTWRSP